MRWPNPSALRTPGPGKCPELMRSRKQNGDAPAPARSRLTCHRQSPPAETAPGESRSAGRRPAWMLITTLRRVCDGGAAGTAALADATVNADTGEVAHARAPAIRTDRQR